MSTAPAQHEHGTRPHKASFLRGIAQFNAERFFDAHETWEEIWLHSPEPQKTFYQGIIQISAVFHHYHRANMLGTRSLLEAGLRRVGQFPDAYNGIALEALRAATREWVTALAAGLDPGPKKVPRIHLDETDGK
jgi:predicted metal-dependent hydrolase